MKRADLAVGMDVFTSRARDWQQYGGGSRFRIVDAGKWDEGYRPTFSRVERVEFESGPYMVDCRVSRVTTGAAGGVLAIQLDPKTGAEITDLLTVLPPARIKATWEEGQAAIAAARDRRNESERAAEVEREKARAEADDLTTRLAAAGITLTPEQAVTLAADLRTAAGSPTATVTVTAEQRARAITAMHHADCSAPGCTATSAYEGHLDAALTALGIEVTS